MTLQLALDIGQKTLWTILTVAGPILFSAIVIGISVSLFQSMTQINEMTLVFVPKIVVVMVTTVIFLPWVVAILTQFSRELLFIIPQQLR